MTDLKDAWAEKEEWARGLQVGDEVEDCRYQVHRIARLRPKYVIPRWARRALNLWELGFSPSYSTLNTVEDKVESFLFKLNLRVWVDADLELDDGSHCSAMSCCDDPSGRPADTKT